MLYKKRWKELVFEAEWIWRFDIRKAVFGINCGVIELY